MADDTVLDVDDVPDVEVADELELAGGFTPSTLDAWRALVAKVLKVDPAEVPHPEDRLTTALRDGVTVRPLYTRADALPSAGLPGSAPYVRGGTVTGNRGGWDVRQRHAHPDPKVAHEQALEDLEGGVTSLWLVLGAGGFPVDALPDVLAEVYLDLAGVALDAGADQRAAADALLALAGDTAGLRGTLGLDPLGHLARTGDDLGTADLAELANRCAAGRPDLRAAVVDALPYHCAGATDAQELACAVATGVAYLRVLDEAGLPPAQALRQLEFRLAATADQFSTVAKLRAARRMWATVAATCGAPHEGGMRQHAVSSPVMVARRDPWNNILRGALAAFGAGVGGADAVTVLPFDAAIGLPDPLARRVARNTHALLVEESHVASVLDPAGGSWYVEQLTEDLAATAWRWFQEIERAGGMRAALDGGLVADAVAAARDELRRGLGTGAVTLTGVSTFPDLTETPLVRDPAPTPVGGGLPQVRWAQWHEALRDRADALGSPSVAAVALDGAPTARLRSLLAPVGLTVDGTSGPVVAVVAGPTTDPRDVRAAVDAARAGGASLVLLTGADADADADADIVLGRGTDVLELGARILDVLEAAR